LICGTLTTVIAKLPNRFGMLRRKSMTPRKMELKSTLWVATWTTRWHY